MSPLPAIVLLVAAIQQSSLEQYERTGQYPTPKGIARFVEPVFSGLTRSKQVAGVALVVFYAASALAFRSARLLRRGPLAQVPQDEALFSVYYRSTGNLRFWSRPAYAAMLAPVAASAAGRHVELAPTLPAEDDVTRSRVGR